MTRTLNTSAQEVAAVTKTVMFKDAIPNILLSNTGNPNGFTSEKKNYQYWITRVCGRHN